MKKTTKIWLIRHGEPVAEARGRCYGSLDFGLSDIGRGQMARVAEYLKDEPAQAVFASPLSRALESARIVARGISCPVEVLADFREIDFGDFEGLAYDEIASRYPDIYREWMESPSQVRFPNGESLSDMRVRVLGAFEEILRQRGGETLMVVSHGGVNRILIAWALQIPDGYLFRVGQDYASVNLLAVADGSPMVLLLNHSCSGQIRPGKTLA